MAWNEEMVPMLRGILGDFAETPQYSDDRLEDMLVYAAQLIHEDIPFDLTYTITVRTSTISPDPTTPARDDAFINMTVLKAACMLAGAEARLAAKKGISVKDGPSSIDGKGLAQAAQLFAEDMCKKFQRAVMEYRAGNSKAGEAIVGPYRYEDHLEQPRR
jgi:hypothetical protein